VYNLQFYITVTSPWGQWVMHLEPLTHCPLGTAVKWDVWRDGRGKAWKCMWGGCG